MRRLEPGKLRQPRQYLGRRAWDLARFGLTPRKLAHRLRGSPAPPVVFTSIPKAGTHLTERLLCLHPDYHRRLVGTTSSSERLSERAASLSNGQLLCAHVGHSGAIDAFLRERGIRVVFSLRDPRDILVSRAHYIQATRDHHLHDLALRHPDLRDRIAVLIEGEPAAGLTPYREVILSFAGWLRGDTIVVRFEDLINPQRRPQMTAEVFEQLGVAVNRAQVERISGLTVSPASPTFRRGRTGEWEDVFDESLRGLFDDAVGDLLGALGY